MNALHNNLIKKEQKGLSLPEVIIVLLIIAILVVLALPQISASRRLSRFSGFQRQISTSLNEAKQNALAHKTATTFRYDNAAKRVIIYGGNLGALGSVGNRTTDFADSGLLPEDVVYGYPPGAAAVLGDGSNITGLSADTVDVTFQADGSVINTGDGAASKALYFYDKFGRKQGAFAISISCADGRMKTWRYSKAINRYIE